MEKKREKKGEKKIINKQKELREEKGGKNKEL